MDVQVGDELIRIDGLNGRARRAKVTRVGVRRFEVGHYPSQSFRLEDGRASDADNSDYVLTLADYEQRMHGRSGPKGGN